MPEVQRLAVFAARNHAVFHVAHAAMLGFTDREIQCAYERGVIDRVHQGVYRFVAAPADWRGDLLAACWAGGFRAFASHRSAARVHDLPGGRDDLCEITCPRWRRSKSTRVSSLVVHEHLGIDVTRDVDVVDGLPVASIPLTLLGLAAVRPGVTELALEAALRRRLTSLTELDEFMTRWSGRGRRGAARLRRLLAERDPALRPTASEMETLLLAAVRRHGLPEPRRQVDVRYRGRVIATLDGGWPQWKVGYEYDSDEFHTGRVRTASDSARRHHVAAAGWLVTTVVNADLARGGTLACLAMEESLRQRRSRSAS